jgi:hypothetical protein
VTFLIFRVFFTPNRLLFLKLPQGRHPERSASQIYRLTEGLWRAVEGPRRCLLADALHSFPATKIMKEIKKVTSSERSASQIDRVTQHLWRAAEGPRRAYRFDPRTLRRTWGTRPIPSELVMTIENKYCVI